MYLLPLAAERGRHKHAQAHDPRIAHFDAHLGRAEVRIENRADVADPALEDLVGIGVQADFGGVAQAHIGQIVFVHVADDPDVGQVRNRERVRAKCLHPRGIRDLLVGNHSRDRRVDVHDAVRLIGVVAEQPEMLCRSFDIDFGLVFGVLGNLKIVH